MGEGVERAGMKAKIRTVPRGQKEFAELRKTHLRCVVVSRDNNYREVERPAEVAWGFLDGDPKAKLLDLGDGAYKVERRPWPMWYLLKPAAGTP